MNVGVAAVAHSRVARRRTIGRHGSQAAPFFSSTVQLDDA